MGKINAQWHKANPMPKKPTAAQRAEWHYQHALHCGCRALNASSIALLTANGYDIPEPVVP